MYNADRFDICMHKVHPQRGSQSKHIAALINSLQANLRAFGMEETQYRFSRMLEKEQARCDRSHAGITVIPAWAEGPALCSSTVLAIAYGTKGQGGLTQVLQQLRVHLIECAQPNSGFATQTVLIVYDTENQRTFWESKKDFREHHQLYGVGFIRLYWDGNSLNERSAF